MAEAAQADEFSYPGEVVRRSSEATRLLLNVASEANKLVSSKVLPGGAEELVKALAALPESVKKQIGIVY